MSRLCGVCETTAGFGAEPGDRTGDVVEPMAVNRHLLGAYDAGQDGGQRLAMVSPSAIGRDTGELGVRTFSGKSLAEILR